MAVLSLLHSFFFIISLLVSLIQSQQLSTDPSYYYNLCAPTTCNNLSIRYPFTPSTPCHVWSRITSCLNNKTFLISSPRVSNTHRILSINYTDPTSIRVIIAANELFTCPSHISKPIYRARGTSFTLPFNYVTGTHFNCTAPIPSNNAIKGLQNASCIGCKGQDPSNVCYYAPGFLLTAPTNCETFGIYTKGESFDPSRVGNLRAYLQLGFELQYSKPVNCLECEETGGRCGTNPLSGTFVCFCSSSVHYRNCSDDPASITLIVAANKLFACPSHISKQNYRTRDTSFTLPSNYVSGTHFNCIAPIPSNNGIIGLQNASCIGCKGQDPSNVCYYAPGICLTAPNCETFDIHSPGKSFDPSGVGNLRTYLQLGFELKYSKPADCLESEETGGRCGTNPFSGSFLCFCPASVHYRNCSDGISSDISTWADKHSRKLFRPSRIIVAVISAIVATLMLVVIIALVMILSRRRQSKFNFNKETISNISPTRYSYPQLKKFTTNFSSKLGEGGFGSVYKGVLSRGASEMPIAVKMLKKSSQTKKQFMNEVTTIGSIHHQNLVGMLGYCFEGDTHALVYEFVENGSLDNYIYNNRKENKAEDRKWLSYNQLYTIGLETAKGLLYLHNGCYRKILHCDIKPSNILLDSSYSVKIADFGLARMINDDHGHVTISRAQGTPGYSAPEMWLKTYGPVTDKSDVYSYGMLLLEMVGRRKNYDAHASGTSQVYYPEWIYNQIEKTGFHLEMTESGGDDTIMVDLDGESIYEDDVTFFQKMCLVGLWCIQHNPANRPSMSKVVQMLEGNVEIDMPPHPFQQNASDFHGSTS